MADGDSRGLGYDDPDLGVMTDNSLPIDAIQDSSTLSGDDASRAFLASAAAWDLDVLHPDDSYNLGPSTATDPSAQSGFESPFWQSLPFDQQHINSSATASFALPAVNPSPVYDTTNGTGTGTGPNPSERTAALLAMTSANHPLATLTPALQEELRNIAMPQNHPYESPRSTSSPESPKTGISSSPDASGSSLRDTRKRKVSAELDEDDDPVDEQGKPVKKTAHNMIEKRYRTNINDKIAALRDSVPSLRIMCKSARGEDTTEDREELHGLTPAHKLNKATVLSKATEYIHHLEKRNNRLIEQNGEMQARLAAFEKLWMGGAMGGAVVSNPISQPPASISFVPESHPQQALASPMETPRHVNGLSPERMDSPEDVKSIIPTPISASQPYPAVAQPIRYSAPQFRMQAIQTQPQTQSLGWAAASPYLGKLMVSSLAGLMILEAVRESELSNEEPQGRGLFALPIHLLTLLPSSIDVHLMDYHFQLSLKFLLLLGVVWRAFFPSFFASFGSMAKKQHIEALQAAPSCASPIETRRKAWLTSIQTLYIPHHNAFLEFTALMFQAFKLGIGRLFGDDAYRRLIGMSEEDEVGRVKAWTIAIDSQLTGGDEELCRARLLLTLLASGTLPDTPTRLMLKALHVRLLLWDFNRTERQFVKLNNFALDFARSKWKKAHSMNQLLIKVGRVTKSRHQDELPSHLAALIQQDCDEVLNDMILQRAHNLAFDAETDHDISWPIESMDKVVEDNSLTAPLDAVAAWWSTETLHDVLTARLDRDEDEDDYLEEEDDDEDEDNHHGNDKDEEASYAATIELAVKVAPAGSIAKLRALLARAVLIEGARGANIAAAVQALTEGESEHTAVSPEEATVKVSAYAKGSDVQLSLRCATTLAHLKRLRSGTRGSKEAFRQAIDKIVSMSKASSMSLLSFVFITEVVEHVHRHEALVEDLAPKLEVLAKHLRIWMGSPIGSECGIGSVIQEKAVNWCLDITRSLLQMDCDPGYSSMSDEEDLKASQSFDDECEW